MAPPSPPHWAIFSWTKGEGGIKVSYGSETLCMTFYGLGDIIEDGFADMCAAKATARIQPQ